MKKIKERKDMVRRFNEGVEKWLIKLKGDNDEHFIQEDPVDRRRCRFGVSRRAGGWNMVPGGHRRSRRPTKTGKDREASQRPGKSITAIVVSYPPGGKSGPHHHAGSVFAYVLAGAIRSENSATGPVKVYKAGESFFEPPGSRHLVSENASAKEPARLLAVWVADDGARLTTFDK
jgi:quercetin dioxygenase-like cupin family protein